MAGHWIEWEKGLVRKPEVMLIARALGSTPEHAAACCMEVWEWAEDVTDNGIIPGLTVNDVSMATRIDGIGEAMLDAGWLLDMGDAIAFSNWDRHNGDPAKRRALNAQRMRTARAEVKARKLKERERRART